MEIYGVLPAVADNDIQAKKNTLNNSIFINVDKLLPIILLFCTLDLFPVVSLKIYLVCLNAILL